MKNVLNLSDYNLHLTAKPHGMVIAYELELIECVVKALNTLIVSAKPFEETDGNIMRALAATDFTYKEIFKLINFVTPASDEFLRARGFINPITKKSFSDEEDKNTLNKCIGYIYGNSLIHMYDFEGSYIINPAPFSVDEFISADMSTIENLIIPKIYDKIEEMNLVPASGLAVRCLAIAVHNALKIIRVALCSYVTIVYEDKLVNAEYSNTIPHIQNMFQLLLNSMLSLFEFYDDEGGYIQAEIDIEKRIDSTKTGRIIEFLDIHLKEISIFNRTRKE